MNVGLDYDGTFTSDPTLWIEFVKHCQARSHSVWIVTMRYPSECDGSLGSVDGRLRNLSVPVVCTSRGAKRPFCEKLGIHIDIWIDDNPEAVVVDGSAIWGAVSAEGDVIDPHYR